jgi:hypothetical protein
LELLCVFVSAVLMIRQCLRTWRRAAEDAEFVPLAGASLALIVTGTIAYTLGEDWSVVDGFYFSVATLTTSSIADPELTLTDPWLKVFTSFYILIGIGLLVTLVGRLGLAFVALRREDTARKAAEKAAP